MLKTDDLTLVLTNRQKIFWPEHGYTKGDLDYYRDIAPFMLPYLKDRRQVLHRHVNGHRDKEPADQPLAKSLPAVAYGRKVLLSNRYLPEGILEPME